MLTYPTLISQYYLNNDSCICCSMNTCKELVDGLRVYFDYTLTDLLLYNRERDQVVTAQATELSLCSNLKQEHRYMFYRKTTSTYSYLYTMYVYIVHRRRRTLSKQKWMTQNTRIFHHLIRIDWVSMNDRNHWQKTNDVYAHIAALIQSVTAMVTRRPIN